MANQDDNFLREVEEEIRRERFERLWKEYGTYFIAGAALIVIGVLGYKFVENRRVTAAQTTGERYEGAMELASTGKDGSAEKEFASVVADGTGGYPELARLQLAGVLLKQGKKAEAIAAYEELAKSANADPLLRDYAALQAASARMGEADFTELQNRLTPLMADASPWRFSARELLGVAAFKAGKADEARSTLTPLLDRPEDAAEHRRARADRACRDRCVGDREEGGRRADRAGGTGAGRHQCTGCHAAGRSEEVEGTRMRGGIRRWGIFGGSLSVLALLCGCADGPTLPKLNDLNPFAEKAVPLPGKRIPVMQTQSSIVTGELADASAPIMLPAPFANEDWAQPGGLANNSPGHLAFSGSGQETWRADAGSGSSSAGRVTASPIVYANHVYALDAKGNVSAFSTSGSSLWRVSLRPGRENTSSSFLSAFSLGGGDDGSGGYGGGLAVDGGRLYAASGFGNVVALDPETGAKIWEKQLDAPVRSAPAAVGGKVFVVALDGKFFCLAGADGGELWSVRGLPQQASLINNASPAVEGDIVVVPYPSGDLVALHVADGSAAWSESLSRTRTTSADDVDERRGTAGDRRRHRVRRRSCRAHGRDADGDGRAALVAQRPRHAAAVGRRRQRVRRRHTGSAPRHLAPRRQGAVDDQAAWHQRLVGADACGQHALARLRQGSARRRRGVDGASGVAEGAGQPGLRAPRGRPGAHVCPDRQRQADRA